MPEILLIRHGETEYVKEGKLAGRLPGVHLNERGRQQAHQLAEKLKNNPIKAVYSSPLERTSETAQPIAQALGLEVIYRSGLIETDFGEWQDHKISDLRKLNLWKLVQSTPGVVRFPEGESFFSAQHRISMELLELSHQHSPKDILVCVSHSDPIRLAVAYFIGLPLDLFQRLTVFPGSITALSLGGKGARLLYINLEPEFRLAKK